MRVEMLKTLKGSTIWKKGAVFDDTVSPIPGDILREVDSGTKTVKVTATEKPIVVVETEIETQETVEETSGEKPAEDPPQEKESIALLETEESFKCNMCRFVGKTKAALKRHNTMNHK